MANRFFDRFCQVKAADDNKELLFGSYLAYKFDIIRTADTDPGKLELEIYNLNKDSRAFIERKHVNIELTAGYKAYNGIVFKGAVEFGSSEKQNGNWCTKVIVLDGAIHWRNIVINKSFKKGTEREKVIESLINDLTALPPNIKGEFQKVNQGVKGDIASFSDKHYATIEAETKRTKAKKNATVDERFERKQESRAVNAANAEPVKKERGRLERAGAFKKLQILCDSYGLEAVWDLQTLSIVPKSIAIPKAVPTLSATSGLIGTPKRIETGWEVECFIQHDLFPGSLVYVESEAFEGTLIISRLEFHGQTHGGGEWKNTIQGEPYDV